MIINKTLNKVISSSPTLQETLLDLTADTVAPGNLAKNETAHDKEGDRITGRFLTEDAEAWAVGQRNGVPVTEEDVTYHNNSYWYAKKAEAESVVSGSCMLIAGQHAEDSEAWAVGERDGVPVENTDETYENNAKFYASNAAESEAKAHDSEIISGSFMRIAGNYSEDSEAYAIGKRGGVDVPSTDPTYHNNAKYWADYASQYAQGGLIYKGSILFANIPTSGMVKGDMYNIENDFTTDSRFEEGAGVFVKAGTNIAWNGNKWDVLATGGGGGHTILNESGTEMPQRSKLKFEGCEVTDDSTNDITKIKAEGGEVLSYADYQQLTPEQQASGDYYIPDVPINSSILPMGGFDNTPTIGSLNPVTSDGIARNIDSVTTDMNVIELTTTAAHSHSVGDYFMLIGQFVKCVTAIEIGDTIVIGTNVEATNIADVLSQLNSKIGIRDISDIGLSVTGAISNIGNKCIRFIDYSGVQNSASLNTTMPFDGIAYPTAHTTGSGDIRFEVDGITVIRKSQYASGWQGTVLIVKKGSIISYSASGTTLDHYDTEMYPFVEY